MVWCVINNSHILNEMREKYYVQLISLTNTKIFFHNSYCIRAYDSRGTIMTDNVLDCSVLFNCCSCGGNDCGCAYCFDCNACASCKEYEKDDINQKCENVNYNE